MILLLIKTFLFGSLVMSARTMSSGETAIKRLLGVLGIILSIALLFAIYALSY